MLYKRRDIDKNNNNYSLISALGDTCNSTLIKRCNKYSYEYYTFGLYQKTGEEAIYAHHMIKDVKLP